MPLVGMQTELGVGSPDHAAGATKDMATRVVPRKRAARLVVRFMLVVLRTTTSLGARFGEYRCAPTAQSILATAESVEEKRKEFDHLKRVEIPANLKAIQEARELGDLSENFEYKSARQRQEYLSARATALDGELQRVRILDPAAIDPGEIRVGTRVVLRNGDVEREVMILGPWESDPERGVYSHESDVAKALIGRREGDIASFLGNDYLVRGIRRWTE